MKGLPGLWKIVTVVAVAIVNLVVVWYLITAFKDNFGLPALALVSIVVLLAALFGFAALMSMLELSDKTQALGLPEGSVRAVIALALVGMFAILSSALLVPRITSVTAVSHITASGLSMEDIARLLTSNPGAHDVAINRERAPAEPTAPNTPGRLLDTYGVTFTPGPAPPGPVDDFTKQLLTLIGTLMTAVTSFYFAGRIAAGRDDGTNAAPVLSGVESLTDPIADGKLSLRLHGTHLNTIRTVRLDQGDKDYQSSSVLSNDGVATATFTGVEAAVLIGGGGKWDVSAVDDIGRTATGQTSVTFTAPPKVTATAPVPRGVTPPNADAGEAVQRFVVSGDSLAGVTAVTASGAAGTSIGLTVDGTPSASEVNCSGRLGAGVWTFAVAAADGVAVPVPGQVTVA